MRMQIRSEFVQQVQREHWGLWGLWGLVAQRIKLSKMVLVGMFLLTCGQELTAFPPTPDHVIYGLVRDQFGNPIVAPEAEVRLTSSTGVALTTEISPGLGPEFNYRLRVPMDAGLTHDAYIPTAMRPTVPFRLSVKIGGINYVPIEMKGDLIQLGQPAAETHLDLTLGEDSDGDGLPDAWERTLFHAGGSLASVNAESDTDGDGMSDLSEYLAGTYAFDPSDGFRLEIKGVNDGWPILEFVAIRGRAYSLLRSRDLDHWDQVPFRIAGSDPGDPTLDVYFASDVRTLRIEADPDGMDDRGYYFKLSLR